MDQVSRAGCGLGDSYNDLKMLGMQMVLLLPMLSGGVLGTYTTIHNEDGVALALQELVLMGEKNWEDNQLLI